MAGTGSISIRTGIVAGVLFAVHISIPNCGSYPFIWPAAAGAFAFWTVSRTGRAHPIGEGLLTALATGATVALVGFIGISLIVFVAGHSQFSAAAATTDLSGRFLMLMTAELTIVTLCALAGGAAVLAAVAAAPVKWLRHRRSDAPAA